MRAGVAELGKGSVKQAVLFPEWLVIRAGMCLGRLERHVRVGDFGYAGEKENRGEQEDEAGNSYVDPLHVLKRLRVIESKEHVRPKNGGNHSSDAIEGLGDVDSDFRKLWRSTNWLLPSVTLLFMLTKKEDERLTRNVWVRCCLERAKAIANDENANAEPSERLVHNGRDGEERANAVQA